MSTPMSRPGVMLGVMSRDVNASQGIAAPRKTKKVLFNKRSRILLRFDSRLRDAK